MDQENFSHWCVYRIWSWVVEHGMLWLGCASLSDWRNCCTNGTTKPQASIGSLSIAAYQYRVNCTCIGCMEATAHRHRLETYPPHDARCRCRTPVNLHQPLYAKTLCSLQRSLNTSLSQRLVFRGRHRLHLSGKRSLSRGGSVRSQTVVQCGISRVAPCGKRH